MNDILNILSNIIDNSYSEDNNSFLLALTMYINFYYEHIVCEEKMMNYLVDSERMINNIASIYPQYTRRQVESTYIALTICFLLLFNLNIPIYLV